MVSILLREAYRHSLDWSVWATPRRGDSPVVAGIRGIFPLVQSYFRPQLGDRALFHFWEDDWSGLGRLGDAFPHLYALVPDPPATVRTMWTGTWTPILSQALSDQRLADFMSLQIRLANLRPPAETQDSWIWSHSRYSTREVYRLLRGQEFPEAASLVRHCRVIWKYRLPQKIRIFGWLLLRHRLMTRVIRRHIVPGAVVSCSLCAGEDKDCSHLFFTCPIVQEAWRTGGVAHLVASSDEVFWSSLIDGSFRRETDWRQAFAMLWAIWLHRNEVIFRGVTHSSDAIIHAAGGVFSCNRGDSGPLHLVPL